MAYFPERYGDQLIPSALSVVNGAPVPPAVFVKHVLVTPQNVCPVSASELEQLDHLSYVLVGNVLDPETRRKRSRFDERIFEVISVIERKSWTRSRSR